MRQTNTFRFTMAIAFMVFLGAKAFAQELPTPFPKEDVQKLEKKVLKMFKKTSHESTDGVRVFHVFDVACDIRDKRETFEDTSFVKKLKYGYVKVKCSKYLLAASIVCDSVNKIRGIWFWDTYFDHKVFYEQSFIDTLDSRHIVHVYRVLDGLKDPLLIGVTDDCKTCLIDSQKHGYKVYPISECSDLQWNYILKGHPKLEIESSLTPKKEIVIE